MKIRTLQAENFRNLSSVEISFCETANIIYGDNGQGKTNLLEAVWMFTGAKSFRGGKDAQLVQFEAERARLSLDFFGGGREQNAQIAIETRRLMKLNEIPLRGAAEMAGHFCAVTFSPTHLTLVKSGPREKRRFIDDAICQIKPKYLHVLSQYERVLDQRNRLLKDGMRCPGLYDTLDVWDARLASLGAVIIKTRVTFLDRLRPIAKEAYAGISQEREKLDFRYESTMTGESEGSIAELEEVALTALMASRAADKAAGMTNLGPHRDDIGIEISGKSARLYASQGQQRSCVLALKLAECRILYETVGEYPVVLLDDVMSELDEGRRGYLLNQLGDRQILITCCDRKDFRGLGEGMAVELKEGDVISLTHY